jgi:hypothetical protein
MTMPPADQSWHIIQRWQQHEGEARANLLRIGAIGTFYLIHLWNYLSSQGKLPHWGFFLLMTLASVCFGLLAVAPGLGIPVCVLLVPVLIRTTMVVRRREAAGAAVSRAVCGTWAARGFCL